MILHMLKYNYTWTERGLTNVNAIGLEKYVTDCGGFT